MLIILIIGTSCSRTHYVNSLVITTQRGETHLPKELRLIYNRNLFFVDVIINGKRGRLLVDTGASISIIDINQAKKYGFKYHSKNVSVMGIGGSTNRYRISNIKTKTKYDETVLITYNGADISSLVNNMALDGIDIVGVLGSDYLMNTGAVLDYGEKKLNLYTKF